jgi:hypothetical protein
VVDCLSAAACVWLAFQLTPFSPGVFLEGRRHIDLVTSCIAFALFVGLTSNIAGLQSPLLDRRRGRLLVNAGVASLAGMLLLATFVFGILYLRIGRWIMLQTVAYTSLALVSVRVLLWNLIAQRSRQVVLLGSKESAALLESLIQRHQAPLTIVSRLDRDDFVRAVVDAGWRAFEPGRHCSKSTKSLTRWIAGTTRLRWKA